MTLLASVPLKGGVVHRIEIDQGVLKAMTPVEAASDLFAGPPLFDIQVNGYAGYTCQLGRRPDGKPRPLRAITDIFHRHGIGFWVPTVITASNEALLTSFRLLAAELDTDRALADTIPGFHLEGPYISAADGPRGAHALEHARPPEWDEFQHIQEAAGGRILYITVAPELEGMPAFIRRCVASGVMVALGHSNMTRDDLARAIDAGARLSTHLGNGAHDMIQRHNNYLWYQLAAPELYASFITDGQHLPSEALYCMLRAKGLERSVIVSDCVALGGMPPGKYGTPPKEEVTEQGRICMVGTPNLAGSYANLRECVEGAVRYGGLSLTEAWRLATEQPAAVLGLGDRFGLVPGRPVNLTLYRYDESGSKLDVRQTWVAGQKVFDADLEAADGSEPAVAG